VGDCGSLPVARHSAISGSLVFLLRKNAGELMQTLRKFPAIRGAAGPWRILLLTCRSPRTDFRLSLAQELQALGHDVTYAFVKRNPVITEMKAPDSARVISMSHFLSYVRVIFSNKSWCLVFNSTNLVAPMLCHVIKKLCGGLWCFDMHDDLLYGRAGHARRKALMAQHILLRASDFVVHAAPTLKELFPHSYHLGNASSIEAISRPCLDFDRVLILASLDARFDFELVSAAAGSNPHLAFDIYGQVSQNDRNVAGRVRDLTGSCSNVFYHGPYVNDDLPRILGSHAVTLAPYATNSVHTRYIDPLRYYHCLNSGMEVISTDIPKARDLEQALHIIRTPNEIGPLIQQLRAMPAARRNSGSTASVHNWRNRALSLLDIAAGIHQSRTQGALT
jgi:hypothetical protein